MVLNASTGQKKKQQFCPVTRGPIDAGLEIKKKIYQIILFLSEKTMRWKDTGMIVEECFQLGT